MAAIDSVRFTFLYIGFYSMGSTWAYPEARIPYHIFRYVVKGSAVFYIDGEEIIVSENQIAYIPSGCKLSCKALTETFDFYSIRFATSVFNDSADVLSKHYGIRAVTDNQGEDIYFQEIYRCVKSDHVARKCFVRGYLDLLIGSLSLRGETEAKEDGELGSEDFDLETLKNRERKSTRQMDYRVQAVADYIIFHPTEKYTPEKMADMASLSKQRFSSLFKTHMGKTPMEYVREIRLTTAARTLLVSDKSINDVAYSVGYEDTNYFIREFKSAFGFTPNRYRKIAREG